MNTRRARGHAGPGPGPVHKTSAGHMGALPGLIPARLLDHKIPPRRADGCQLSVRPRRHAHAANRGPVRRHAARTWGAAALYAEADASAASAMLASEDRLRTLHPYTMARYDRLRADGLSATDAMTEAAPFFARHPFVREGEPGTARPALTAAQPGDAENWIGRPQLRRPARCPGRGDPCQRPQQCEHNRRSNHSP